MGVYIFNCSGCVGDYNGRGALLHRSGKLPQALVLLGNYPFPYLALLYMGLKRSVSYACPDKCHPPHKQKKTHNRHGNDKSLGIPGGHPLLPPVEGDHAEGGLFKGGIGYKDGGAGLWFRKYYPVGGSCLDNLR